MDLSLHLTLLTTTGLFQAIAGGVGQNHVNARYFKPGEPLEVSCSAAMFDMSEIEQVFSITLSRIPATTNDTEEMFSVDFEGNTLKIKEGRTDGTWLYNISSNPFTERVDVKVLYATKEDSGIYGCRMSFLFLGQKKTLEKWERLYCKDEMSDSQGNHSTAGIVAGVPAVLVVVVVVVITIGLFRKRCHPSHRIVECTCSAHKQESQLMALEQETIGQTLQYGCHSHDLPSESSLRLDRRQDDNDFSKHFISGQRYAGIYSTEKNKSQLMTELATIGPMLQESGQVNDPPSDPAFLFDTRQDNNGAVSKPSDNRDTRQEINGSFSKPQLDHKETTLRTTPILFELRHIDQHKPSHTNECKTDQAEFTTLKQVYTNGITLSCTDSLAFHRIGFSDSSGNQRVHNRNRTIM